MRKWGIVLLVSMSVLIAMQVEAENLVDNGNATVTDKKTKLVWQKCSVGQAYIREKKECSDSAKRCVWYQVGENVCKALTIGGHSDWRLPTRDELVTILVVPDSPTINTAYFPNTKASKYWTSTNFASAPSLAWFVDFRYSNVGYDEKRYGYYVRCVRGGK